MILLETFLPEKRKSNFGREMKTLSQLHVRTSVSDAASCTIKYDGTTKAKKHITEVEIATKDQTFLIGMREQNGGCASEYVDTIKTCIGDVTAKSIDTIVDEGNDTKSSLNISNTMSDRVVTNACVDRLLESDVLGIKVNSFKCAVHPLDTIGKESEKCVLQAEKEMEALPNNVLLFKRSGESDTQALIKNTGKLFYNDATGCCKDLTAFIKEKLELPESEGNIRSKLFHRFVGNRFHIYFLDAGLVDYYTQCLLEFFEKVHVPTNGMQSSLYNILKSKCRSVSLRALGLVGKFVTGPWMRFIPTCQQILDVNIPLQKAVETLTSWSSDASPVMNGTADAVFCSVPLLKDSVYHYLLSSRGEKEDNRCKELLQELFDKIKAVILVFFCRTDMVLNLLDHMFSGERKDSVIVNVFICRTDMVLNLLDHMFSGERKDSVIVNGITNRYGFKSIGPHIQWYYRNIFSLEFKKSVSNIQIPTMPTDDNEQTMPITANVPEHDPNALM
ncbi:hypothetical protein GQR58_014553 [Nymphon striatum]|nr:hypothetical protein GQR58_014553 [Nymphon striatum]